MEAYKTEVKTQIDKWSLYAIRKRKVFKPRLKATVDRKVLSSVGISDSRQEER